MLPYLWLLCCCFVFPSVILTGKDTSKKKGGKDKRPLPDVSTRTYEQWSTLPLETLRRHCEAVGLPLDGDTFDLALQLYRHYNQVSSGTSSCPASAAPTTSTLDDPLDLVPVSSLVTFPTSSSINGVSLDWLFSAPPSVADMLFSTPPTFALPAMSAPDGGFTFATSLMNPSIPCTSDGIPRIKIRRQPIFSTSTQPSMFDASDPGLPPSNAQNSYASSSSRHDTYLNIPDVNIPGPSRSSNNGNTVAQLQQELEELKNTVTSLSTLIRHTMNCYNSNPTCTST